jgi:hypothetical protein
MTNMDEWVSTLVYIFVFSGFGYHESITKILIDTGEKGSSSLLTLRWVWRLKAVTSLSRGGDQADQGSRPVQAKKFIRPHSQNKTNQPTNKKTQNLPPILN